MAADEAKAMALKYSPDEAKAMAADEAKAMALKYSPDEAKNYGVVASRYLKPVDPDEVSAHSMPGGLINRLGSNPVLVTIVYDTEMECYKVT
jgi:hypothetical protein